MMYVVGFLLLMIVLQMCVLIWVMKTLLESLQRDLERPVLGERYPTLFGSGGPVPVAANKYRSPPAREEWETLP